MLTRYFFSFLCFLALLLGGLSSCDKRTKQKYTIAFDPLWYPINFLNKENNVVGFSTDLLLAISKEESVELTLVATNWDTLLQGLKTKSYDAVLSSLYPYNFNLSLYNFSAPYLALGPVLVVHTSSSYRSLSDLKKKAVGALENSSSLLLLEKYPQITIRSYNNPSSLINGLLIEEIDAGLLPVLIAESFTSDSFAGTLRIATDPLNDEGLRLITLKQSPPRLVETFNRGLKTVKKKGTYQALLEKWNLQE